MAEEDAMIGYWMIDVPVSPEETAADMAILNQIQMPEGAVLWMADVIVHGRRWTWERVDVRGIG